MPSTTWLSTFSGLERLEPSLMASLAQSSKVVHLPAGTRIYGPGQIPEAYLLVIRGSVRVQQVSDAGREIVLYRVQAGESCALTTACLIGHEEYHAEAIAETEIEAVALPRSTFDDLVTRSREFRQFVFRAFSQRMTDLFKLVEDVAFSRVDIRLAERLVLLADKQMRVSLTHQQLASELGTAREVVSRQLNEFQRRGWITTSRGAIDLLNTDALRSLAKAP